MASPTAPIQIACHSNHLFHSPLCDHLSTLKKTAHFFFHFFTLGIPLLLHYFVTGCIARAASIGYMNEGFLGKITASLRQRQSAIDDDLKRTTIDFAMQKLREKPDTKSYLFKAGYYDAERTNQPTNVCIAQLITLYFEACKIFTTALQENPHNSWSSEAVIAAADTRMKLSYAISVLTLEDLQPFTKALAQKGNQRSYAKALTGQDSYLYRTFYYCTNAYHNARGGLIWTESPWRDRTKGQWYPQAEAFSKEHAQLFYQKGTIQNSWNRLYNDYCDRIGCYVNRDELFEADNRHVRWTKKDIGMITFYHTPDTQPT